MLETCPIACLCRTLLTPLSDLGLRPCLTHPSKVSSQNRHGIPEAGTGQDIVIHTPSRKRHLYIEAVMGVYYETIPNSAVAWIHAQKAWWVATAPLSGNGHVNVSPKGGESGKFFGVLDERTFWYMDLSGSGNETISHLREPGNGRITIMFNAFEGPPKIIRVRFQLDMIFCSSWRHCADSHTFRSW